MNAARTSAAQVDETPRGRPTVNNAGHPPSSADQLRLASPCWIIDCNDELTCSGGADGKVPCVRLVTVSSISGNGSKTDTLALQDDTGILYERTRERVFSSEDKAVSASLITALETERLVRLHINRSQRRLGTLLAHVRPHGGARF